MRCKNLIPTINQQKTRHNYSRYNRWYKFAQFLSHVTIGEENECWEWQGSIFPSTTKNSGYGAFTWKEKHTGTAHVASYILFNGSIPKRRGKHKLCVLHKCDNPPCVNPKHLWLGTTKQNVRDRDKKGRTSRGEFHYKAKITQVDVDEIRDIYGKRKQTIDRAEFGDLRRKLAKEFNVSECTIQDIVYGRSWKDTIQ